MPNSQSSMLDARLICCGGLRTDYIITAQGEVRLMQMGGNAVYAAVGARLWLDSVAILARIGESYPLDWLEDLQACGFDTRGIRKVPGPQDHRTFYAYLDEDTRVDTEPAKHFARIGVELPPALRDYVHSTPGQDDPHHYEPLAVTPEDLEIYFAAKNRGQDNRLPTPDFRRADPQVGSGKSVVGLHIAPSSIRTQRHLPTAARKFGVQLVSVDPGERAMRPALMAYIEEMLADIDVFMPSDQEVATLFGDARLAPGRRGGIDAKRCAAWFAARGPRLVVLKLGSDGVLVHERPGGQFWHVPAVPVRVVDVTGAGDAFCGGFMADFVRSGDPVRAAIAGTVSASLAVQDYGALHMLAVTQDEIDRRAALLCGDVSRM